jgi:hypothetical protein
MCYLTITKMKTYLLLPKPLGVSVFITPKACLSIYLSLKSYCNYRKANFYVSENLGFTSNKTAEALTTETTSGKLVKPYDCYFFHCFLWGMGVFYPIFNSFFLRILVTLNLAFKSYFLPFLVYLFQTLPEEYHSPTWPTK